jgi:hypothetical protein
MATYQRANRVSAFRRELNSHNQAQPQRNGQQRTDPALAIHRFTWAAVSTVRVESKDTPAPCPSEAIHFLVGPGYWSVSEAAASNSAQARTSSSGFNTWHASISSAQREAVLVRRQELLASGPGSQQWSGTSGASLPNPSLKLSPNGVAHWPSSAGPSAHFALAVQRATPLVPA